jgi:beta-glucosidase/6-phospho-beta-glucosidase/beta-galactosidase
MSARDFQWMTGFECSAFPQIGADELTATQHDRWWAGDLLRVYAGGVRTVRYGIPWPRVNPRPHEYDWTWTDAAFDLMATLGLTPIVDLFHYGTPLWIEGGIMHPIFGELLARYAHAFAERYPDIVYYTPASDPYLCATFGAELAVWYPFLRGPRNGLRALRNISDGICRAGAAIQAVRPAARLLIPDVCEYYHAADESLDAEAAFRNARRFLGHDLYMGAVTPDHPLWDYLLENGLTETELAWFGPHAVVPDLLGLDYYVYSEQLLQPGPDGTTLAIPLQPGASAGPDPTDTQHATRNTQHALGLAALAAQYSARYGGLPLVVAETNWNGPPVERLAWLDRLRAEAQAARAAGVPLAGITYYGAIDHVDWDSVLRERNGNINPCGLWALERQGDRLVRRPTAALAWYAEQCALPPAASVGEIADPAAQARAAAALAPLAGD